MTDAPLKQTFFCNTSSKQEQQGFIDLWEYKNFFDSLWQKMYAGLFVEKEKKIEL